MCFAEPLMELSHSGKNTITYGRVLPEEVGSLIEAYQSGNPKTDNIILADEIPGSENDNLKNQIRIALRNCGIIDPESLEDYLDRNGYRALEKALRKMSREEVISEIKNSGLRGRGGAGFPTGLKWEFAYMSKDKKKYVVCNADEGDPGAFMDRSVLEGDPHSILEGMAICAYAIGSDEGYIYCRAEYPLAIKRLNIAIKQANDAGYLGRNIHGSIFSFRIHIKEGAGAFVCGEETALMASIEGQRGMPRIRPPFPAQSGLWGHPTNINNVETFANVSWIMLEGSGAYSRFGTEKSKGTKVFALAGKIKNSGLIEVPMGMTLRDVIYKVGNGMLTDKPFKGVQLGGPSGGCLPESLLDTPVDYDSINKTGAIMGSGGMVVMDSGTCMVDVARFFLDFTQKESCGKCTFCRIGTKRMLEILTRITRGEGELEDLDKLEELAVNVIKGSLCGLGQTAPNPVLTTLRYFREEYISHIVEKKCPAGVCKALIKYEIDPEKCVGCTVCTHKCPMACITGERKQIHKIDQEKCIKCGACYEACKFAAIIKS
ncbi:MAG: 4Fe-4S binding protein [Candidatus Cloacimonetes bacterium]|nr:4Fe-4S binding protein [Candidatus Cloacimonadota bacterium]